MNYIKKIILILGGALFSYLTILYFLTFITEYFPIKLWTKPQMYELMIGGGSVQLNSVDIPSSVKLMGKPGCSTFLFRADEETINSTLNINVNGFYCRFVFFGDLRPGRPHIIVPLKDNVDTIIIQQDDKVDTYFLVRDGIHISSVSPQSGSFTKVDEIY